MRESSSTRTIDRFRALNRLAGEALNAWHYFRMKASFEECRLNREVIASHESGTSAPHVAIAHGITVEHVRRIIGDWRHDRDITVRARRQKLR